MGQAASLPVDRREVAIGSPNIKPPSGWSNDENEHFHPISPVSDVSNPSQFRHRLKAGEVVAPQTIYVSNTRRTSKVVGKTPVRKRHSGKVLHPPDRFYFPQERPSASLHEESYPSRHSARSTRWMIYKRRLTAKCHEAKKQIETMGICCKPDQVINQVEDQQTLGASSPVYNKNKKKVDHQVSNDSLSDAGDELDPVFGLSVNETYFGASTRHAKVTAFSDFPAVRQHHIDKSMEPYLQFHEASTLSPPEYHGDSPDDIRRNNTDDSVLLEKSSAGANSSDGSSASDNVLHARNKMESIVKPVYREDRKEKQTENESKVKLHPLDKYARKSANHQAIVKKSHTSTESSRYSYDAYSSSMQDLSRKGRRSEVSETTQLTQSTLLADPSALLKMHLQDVGDMVNSPVAALFGRDEEEDEDYRPRVSSGLYSDMNSLVESNGSVQERLPTGLFSDTGSEIEPEELTYLNTTTRTSMESQRTERTLLAVCNGQNTAVRVSDFTASSLTENQRKESLESQGSRKTVIHAINLPLNEKGRNTFVTGKKNSLDSQKTAKTAITAEPLPFPGDVSKRDTRISTGSTDDKGLGERASISSDDKDRARSESIVVWERRHNAQVKTKDTTRECFRSSNIADGQHQFERDHTLSKKSEGSTQLTSHLHCENNHNGATSEPSLEQPRPRPPLRPSRRSSIAGRETLQLPALLQIAGWKSTRLSNAIESQKEEPKDHIHLSKSKSTSSEANAEDNKENKMQPEIKRQSDPLPLANPKGTTAADMLRQSYPFFAQLRETETSERRLTTKSDPGSSAPGSNVRSTGKFAHQSPCVSVESIPMLSNQVLGNAALLFSPSYLDGTELTRPQTSRLQPTETGAVSINTQGSRGRTLSVISRDPIAIPARPVTYLDSDAASKQSEKRVRFSDVMNLDQGQEVQPSSVEIPPIRHKLSDLSDTTGLDPYRPSISSIRESIAPIPEEPTNFAYSHHAIPEKGRWAYGHDGVTPLRSGRTVPLATNSPLLRFQEARTKFSGGASSAVVDDANLGETTHMPGMRAKGSMVSARVAEMEEKSGKAQTTQLHPSRTEMTAKDSSNYLFEEECETRETSKSASSIWRHRPDEVKDIPERSPTLINGNFVGSHDKSEAIQKSTTRITNKHDAYRSFEAASDYSEALDTAMNSLAGNHSVSPDGESLRDLFKTHKANIEASNDESLSEDEIDDFENMLNYQQDLSEESSVDDETVSTIRQDRSKRFGSQYASYRMSVGAASVASSATGETVSTIKQSRFSVASTHSSKLMKWEQPSLPFRKHAPVKPTEQALHSAPGVLTLSPLQKTPAQARKWRDLAAAAQERSTNRKGGASNQVIRSNLGERSVNVVR